VPDQSSNKAYDVKCNINFDELVLLTNVFSMQFALPHIMGWDRVISQQLGSTNPFGGQPKGPEMRLNPDLEWGR